jgi:CheY-like chemotaxis protein
MLANSNMVVLLAEDNADDALLMEHAFQASGRTAKIVMLSDGSEVIAYLSGEGIYANRTLHPLPDILVLDLKMRRTSGFDVLQWLREHQDFMVIPTVVWSASSDAADVKHAYCLGANAYLCKPTDFPRFKAMVVRLLEFWDDCLKPKAGCPTCEEAAARPHSV